MNKMVNPVPVEWSSGRWSQVSESVLDKSTWPAGPWMSEPDFVGWVDDASGRRCMMVRGSVHGAWLGYVDAVDLLPMFERVEPRMGQWSSLAMMQEAGLPESVIRAPRYCLSYAGRAWQMPGLWLGYDNAHADDYAPGMAAKGYTRAHPSQYITEAVAREHTLKIAAALHSFAMERKAS